MLTALAVLSFCLLIFDLPVTHVLWRRQLRMAPQEVKDERKQSEGDPLIKARRRSSRDPARVKRMLHAVPRATLVIANPTHFAVALRYVRSEGGAPRVVAKGQDLVALSIRRIAEENDIPVIEDKALARSLYAKVSVDQMIPVEFYKAVAANSSSPSGAAKPVRSCSCLKGKGVDDSISHRSFGSSRKDSWPRASVASHRICA